MLIYRHRDVRHNRFGLIYRTIHFRGLPISVRLLSTLDVGILLVGSIGRFKFPQRHFSEAGHRCRHANDKNHRHQSEDSSHVATQHNAYGLIKYNVIQN